jgi:hypothetical protein
MCHSPPPSSLPLSTAKRHFYTSFADIPEGAPTQVKDFGLYRCTPEDEEIMAKGDWSDEANQLIRDRITGLLMTPPPKPPPLPKWLPSPPGPGVAPTEPSPLASVAARHPAVSTAATA